MNARKVFRNTSTPQQSSVSKSQQSTGTKNQQSGVSSNQQFTATKNQQSSISKSQQSSATKSQQSSASKQSTSTKSQHSSASKNRVGALKLNVTTVGSRSPPKVKANLNVTTFSKVPSTDWTAECDLAYSSYLRAQMMKCYAEMSFKCQKEEVDDQLVQQGELLQRISNKNDKLENEITDLEAEIEIRNLCNKLDKLHGVITEVLQDYKVEQNLDKCIEMAETSCNKLYLNNIKPLETQKDYNEFASAVERCCQMLNKLKASIGTTTQMAVLQRKITEFLELQNEFVKKQKMIGDVKNRLALNLFKNVSDKLAELQDL